MTDHPTGSRPEPRDEAVRGQPAPAGLVVDWGGVLTGSLEGAVSDWAHRDRVDVDAFRDVMWHWVGQRSVVPDSSPREVGVTEFAQAPDSGPAGDSPVHRLERGEIEVGEFERELAAELAVRGAYVPPEGLLGRLLAGLAELDLRMVGLVRRARAAGLRTALLSNSWGDHYPEQLWHDLFDSVVISGRVGMRKPEPTIFRYTVDLLGLPAGHCVMVDDLPRNVAGAVGVGMIGVLHRSYEETFRELEAIFDLSLG